MNLPNKHKTCKDCPYYSGKENHGHGENYGSCELVSIMFNHYVDMYYVVYDDSLCKVSEIAYGFENERLSKNLNKNNFLVDNH